MSMTINSGGNKIDLCVGFPANLENYWLLWINLYFLFNGNLLVHHLNIRLIGRKSKRKIRKSRLRNYYLADKIFNVNSMYIIC